MLLPAVFKSMDIALKANRICELLAFNPVLKGHGLVLKPSDAESIMTARSDALSTHGRIELDISVTKTLITSIAASSYVNQDNYVEVINELYEAFHILKNGMSDLVGDEDIIHAIMVYFSDFCRGSTDYLMGKGVEKILQNYHQNRDLSDIRREETEIVWNWSE
jgi:hypothetical protein